MDNIIAYVVCDLERKPIVFFTDLNTIPASYKESTKHEIVPLMDANIYAAFDYVVCELIKASGMEAEQLPDFVQKFMSDDYFDGDRNSEDDEETEEED